MPMLLLADALDNAVTSGKGTDQCNSESCQVLNAACGVVDALDNGVTSAGKGTDQ
jgi:hypothetical protein